MQEKVKTAPQMYLAEAKKCVDTYNRIKNTPTGLASALAKFGKDEHEFNSSGCKIPIKTERAGERIYKPPGEASVAQTAGKKLDDFHGPVNKKRTLALGKLQSKKKKR